MSQNYRLTDAEKQLINDLVVANPAFQNLLATPGGAEALYEYLMSSYQKETNMPRPIFCLSFKIDEAAYRRYQENSYAD